MGGTENDIIDGEAGVDTICGGPGNNDQMWDGDAVNDTGYLFGNDAGHDAWCQSSGTQRGNTTTDAFIGACSGTTISTAPVCGP